MKGLGIGRIVHYVLREREGPEGEHRPAIVVKVLNKERGIAELKPIAGSDDWGLINIATLTSVAYSEVPRPGTWHWPEYVE
jgi:hypothetical protein